MTERLERDVADWIIAEGLGPGTMASLLDGFATRLVAGGVPLSRAYIALPTISPDTRAASVTWRRGEAITFDGVEHDRFPDEFEVSPIHHMLVNDIRKRRWRLSEPDGCEGFALLEAFRARGDTDYLAQVVAFGGPVAPTALRGVALSVCTDRPGGFGPEHACLLESLVPVLALSAYRIALLSVTVEVLGAYVGRDASGRVLSGEMRRGEGNRRLGALLVADLRGFTTAAETGGEDLVPRLGRHLAAMVEPVEAAGGEVLKFMGDGILAAFPADDGEREDGACRSALAAGQEALRRNAAVNAAHGRETRLDLDVALHLGEVFYGNIGAGSRLDFTVIGPAVNEASRLEALCGTLRQNLLMSAPFAAACGAEVVSLGRHRLRGVAEPREVFALPAAETEGPAPPLSAP